MFAAALIGPDGAGKTTIGRRMEHALPLPVKYMYMGINFGSSNVLLPTSRLVLEVKRVLGRETKAGSGPPDRSRHAPIAKGAWKRAARCLKSGLRLTNLVAEECFRHCLVGYYKRAGNIVLFDRWFFADCYVSDIATGNEKRSLSSRLHGFMLNRIYPRPDLVIYLDAPAEVLFTRKGEGTIELLERRRQEYLQLRGAVKHFAVVNVNQPEDAVADEVSALLRNFYHTKRNGIQPN